MPWELLQAKPFEGTGELQKLLFRHLQAYALILV